MFVSPFVHSRGFIGNHLIAIGPKMQKELILLLPEPTHHSSVIIHKGWKVQHS